MPDNERREAGKVAVLRRYPAECRTIEQLTARSEDFCDMCEDLADAEQALLAAQMLPRNVREEKTAEWATSIDRLVAEISRALNEANVIRIGGAGCSRRRP